MRIRTRDLRALREAVKQARVAVDKVDTYPLEGARFHVDAHRGMVRITLSLHGGERRRALTDHISPADQWAWGLDPISVGYSIASDLVRAATPPATTPEGNIEERLARIESLLVGIHEGLFGPLPEGNK